MHLTVLKLPENIKMEILSCLDDKTDAPKWPGCSYSLPSGSFNASNQEDRASKVLTGPELSAERQKILKLALEKACEAIVEREQYINNLDRGCGDGDCGTTLKHLAEGELDCLLRKLAMRMAQSDFSGILSTMSELPLSHPASLLRELANIAEDRMGGTSGALYSLMFTTAATEMSKVFTVKNWVDVWAQAWSAGLDGILKYSKAKLGDKTMVC